MKKTRVLLADDHKVVREGLKLLVNAQRDMRVTGEAGNGREVLRQAREFKPDVVVMDLSMPELNGLQATARLKKEYPAIKVVVLTAYEDPGYLRELCQAGAAGYVLKSAAADELIRAIRAVVEGSLYFDPTLTSQVLANQLTIPPAKGVPKSKELSERERTVLIQLAWGYGNKEIAAKLSLSVKTIETYRSRIGEKLGLHGRAELVQYALRHGWMKETSAGKRLAN